MEIDIESVKVMNLKPDSIIVYRVDEVLSKKSAHTLMERLKCMFPNNRVMVVDNGADIEIIDQ